MGTYRYACVYRCCGFMSSQVHLVKKALPFFGTQKSPLLIASHLEADYSSPHPPILYCSVSILILSTYLCLCHPYGLYPSSFLIKALYAFIFSPMCATGLTHIIHLHLIILLMFCPDLSSSLLGQNILPSTAFSNTLT
jgi:hypothetical protein